jgi:hypothetical protein
MAAPATFEIDDEVEVSFELDDVNGYTFFQGKITGFNADGTYSAHIPISKNPTINNIDPGSIRPLSNLTNDTDVVVYYSNKPVRGKIVSVDKTKDEYNVHINDSVITTMRPRNDIGVLLLSSPDSPPPSAPQSGTPPSGAPPPSTPPSGAPLSGAPPSSVNLALTAEEQTQLQKDPFYQAYVIAKKVVDSPTPKDVLKDELNSASGSNIGNKLVAHINNTGYDKTEKKPVDKNKIRENITQIVNEVKALKIESVIRFVTDYKTTEQELLNKPETSSYLTFETKGVHSSDAFVLAVCDRMQEGLSGPLRTKLREKRKTLYRESLNPSQAIPSIADLEAFFASNPDKSTILLFMTMMKSMLNIEPLITAHNKTFGRFLQKKFETPSLFLNKSNFTRSVSGANTLRDFEKRNRTRAELKYLVGKLNKPDSNLIEKTQIYDEIKGNLNNYERILGSADPDYLKASTLVEDTKKSKEGKVMKDRTLWGRVKKYITGRSGGKKTKHCNYKTRRFRAVKRKTHRKKRRMHTRRQLQVRR